MSMQHHEAVASKACERYLLGEMSEPERFAFEAHYFDCSECADDVRAGDAMARGIQAVSAEDAVLRPKTKVVEMPRRGFMGSPILTWIPSGAAVAMGALAAWQGLVVIPSLRWAGNPQALNPVVLRAAARGDEQTIEVPRGRPLSALSLDVNAASPGDPLRYQLMGPGNKGRFEGDALAPPAGSPLILMLPSSAVHDSGSWILLLLNRKGEEIARYPFSVQIR